MLGDRSRLTREPGRVEERQAYSAGLEKRGSGEVEGENSLILGSGTRYTTTSQYRGKVEGAEGGAAGAGGRKKKRGRQKTQGAGYNAMARTTDKIYRK